MLKMKPSNAETELSIKDLFASASIAEESPWASIPTTYDY